MIRLEQLKKRVGELYQTKNEARDEWADLMWKNHVMIVADNAEKLAERYHADVELAVATALLHDIADAVMARHDEKHEAESERIARELLSEMGFGELEIRIVVDDALRFHSCHGTEKPQTLEGKILATADALAHLKTGFYDYGIQAMKERGESSEKIRQWTSEKIERDFYKKIGFDEVRKEARADYERIRELVSNV